MDRRTFFRTLAGGAALLALRRRALADYQSPKIPLWGTLLRGVGGATGIPLATPDPSPAPVTGVLHYTINIQEFQDQLSPNLGPTTLWGYNPAPNRRAGVPRHLGGIIVANRGVPIQITFRNYLPAKHILPVDTTIPGAELAQNRAAAHLHGGFVPWVSDGGPQSWFDPLGNHGVSFLNNQVFNPRAAVNEAEYFYPNNQRARMMWYHDHAMGITRLNAYAGIASAYLLRDNFEAGLKKQGLPDFIENGGRELPLVIQDKVFFGNTPDADFPGPQTPGSLWYPSVNEDAPSTIPSCVPEFFGDTMLVNGTAYPQVSVEPRRYRLRILNACNARFLNLQLYVESTTTGNYGGIKLDSSLNPLNTPGPDFFVIGTEGGFLSTRVVVPSNMPFNSVTLGGSLVTAPAERWDVLVDFSAFAGKNIILYNDAPAPFPGGDVTTDVLPDPDTNLGPTTRILMRFKVGTAITAPADRPLTITGMSAGLDPFIVPVANIVAGTWAQSLPAGATRRKLTLNETRDSLGRLIQLLGDASGPMAYMDAPTETPMSNAVEVWEIANLTGDTHPVHFHLVNVQVLDRQPCDDAGVPFGMPAPPAAYELGWKETVKMNPGEITRVVMQFKLPVVTTASGKPVAIPGSPRTGGNEYVWHCHILEHEEHDMMRPLVVF